MRLIPHFKVYFWLQIGYKLLLVTIGYKYFCLLSHTFAYFQEDIKIAATADFIGIVAIL